MIYQAHISTTGMYGQHKEISFCLRAHGNKEAHNKCSSLIRVLTLRNVIMAKQSTVSVSQYGEKNEYCVTFKKKWYNTLYPVGNILIDGIMKHRLV